MPAIVFAFGETIIEFLEVVHLVFFVDIVPCVASGLPELVERMTYILGCRGLATMSFQNDLWQRSQRSRMNVDVIYVVSVKHMSECVADIIRIGCCQVHWDLDVLCMYALCIPIPIVQRASLESFSNIFATVVASHILCNPSVLISNHTLLGITRRHSQLCKLVFLHSNAASTERLP